MPDTNADRRTALVFHYQTGTVHVEGVHVYGDPLRGLVFDAHTTFQIENFRCGGIKMWGEDFPTEHSDAFLTWQSPTALRFDRYTTDYDGTGFAMYRDLATTSDFPGSVFLRRTNIRNSPTFAGGQY